MLKKICATLLLLLTILHPKVEKTSLSKTKFNINTIHLKWEPKEVHLSWIKDSLIQPIPNNQWNIQWESQPLHPRIAGITRLIGERQILIDLNPMWKWDWDHVFMHELIHAKQIQDGRLEIKNNTWYWDGELCDWTLPWSARPWEIDAETRACKAIAQNK
jgi:hypothetical protein